MADITGIAKKEAPKPAPPAPAPHPHRHKERESEAWTRERISEIFATEIMSISGGLFAGALIAVSIDRLLLVPGLFVLLPGFLSMRGNILGTLSARLTSALHLGTLAPSFKRHPILGGNLIGAFLLVLLISAALGLIAAFVNWLIIGQFSLLVFYVAILAGILSNIIEIPIAIVSVFQLFKRGYHPENIMGPYITTVGDIVSLVALLIVIILVV